MHWEMAIRLANEELAKLQAASTIMSTVETTLPEPFDWTQGNNANVYNLITFVLN